MYLVLRQKAAIAILVLAAPGGACLSEDGAIGQPSADLASAPRISVDSSFPGYHPEVLSDGKWIEKRAKRTGSRTGALPLKTSVR